MTRKPIQPLPLSLVNRIAAGEVIERPASVVKELVENAIDAGAKNILVEIEEGGKQLLRVIDDGCGIPESELPLAFAEHATSKIKTDDDLFNIFTMGFRGEALASIGAVSHARILSKTADSLGAFEISNNGGQLTPVRAAPGNLGTTVEIRDLFFNVPARSKFLKGASTESGHISDILLRLALPHPNVAFKLLSNGRKNLDLPATSNPVERLLCAWPEEYADQRLPLDLASGNLKITGLVGLPELAHPTTRYQFFYLNGRHIRDRFMQHALRESYRGLTEPGRQPAAILLISIPPADVDVNVHPAKTEVRFKDSNHLHGLILSGIREALLGTDLSPKAIAFSNSPAPQDPQAQDNRQRLADFFKQTYAPTPTMSPSGAGVPTGQESFPANIPNPTYAPSPIPPSYVVPAAAHAPTLAAAPTAMPAIQLHNSYLVTQTPEGMLIIDQHALHERILFEELLAKLTQGPLESQRLLIPEVVDVTETQSDILKRYNPLLEKLGVEVTEFGPTSVAIQAFPSFLEKLQPAKFLHDLLEKGEQNEKDLHEEEMLHDILDMMACKAAVKAGDPLTPHEIEALLTRKDLVDRASNCPHGRPTTLKLSLKDLEKQFKRTGF